jgi:hypothetical protein
MWWRKWDYVRTASSITAPVPVIWNAPKRNLITIHRSPSRQWDRRPWASADRCGETGGRQRRPVCVTRSHERVDSALTYLGPICCHWCAPPLNSGVPEGRDDDELVTGPLAGLGELEMERLIGRRGQPDRRQPHWCKSDRPTRLERRCPVSLGRTPPAPTAPTATSTVVPASTNLG